MEDYETLFDPNVYLKEYFANFDGNQTDFSGTNEDWDYLPSSMQFWFETFSKTNFPGDSMLDVGTGPNLIPSIFASRRFKNIYLSDYAEVNLKALRQWIDRSPEAWDWTPFYKYVAMKEEEAGGPEAIEKRLRAAVKDAFFINVLNDNPIAPKESQQFDCITTGGVFESVSPDRETYKKCVKNVATLLKPGGVILLEGDINESFYMNGDEKFFVLSVDLPFVREAFESAGFKDIEIFEHERIDNMRTGQGQFDAKGYFHVRAVKA